MADGTRRGFSFDGEVIVAGWEPGGGGAGECEAGDPELDKQLFFYDAQNGALLSVWVLERDQGQDENCTIHNYNMIPLRNGNDVVVMGNYQGGVWAVDFTDRSFPETIGWVDPETLGPGPFCGGFCQIGGSWSTYWYNGFIYDSDITRGLQVYGLSDKARASAQRLDRLNPQTITDVIAN